MSAAPEVLPLAGGPVCELGESPFWHPEQQALWWCDIPGHALHRLHPRSGEHRRWAFETDVGCAAPVPGGDVLLALRSGLVRFSPASGQRQPLADAPYAQDVERFNDGKCDPQGRLWVGTIYEPRDRAAATLHRLASGKLQPMAGGITVSNGLAFSPDGRTMLWSDTKAHTVFAFDFDAEAGTISRQREFARFAARDVSQPLAAYGGRPDGAAMDVEGCVWFAMFEGARLVRLSPSGELVQEIALPVRCPTMPALGGPDGRTLYVTTARHGRPADELAREPWAGQVLQLRVAVPGLPVNFARL